VGPSGSGKSTLLRLPATFFADRGAGELADIAMSVSVTRDELSGLLVPLAGAACTIVFEFVLLLFVSPPMAGLAAALLVLAALVAAPLLVVAGRHQREALPREFAMATLTQQLLAGIERIHLSAAQQRILCRWAERNQDAHRRVREVRWAHAVPDILAAALPVAGQVILFALVAGPMTGMLPTRQFFTVNAAFGLLFASASMLFSGCAIIVLVWPRLRWAGELVAAPRERQHVGADPGRLDGGVALHRIRFSYRSDGPPLIPELDIEVAPGEFVAVVGPSGSGKSTLLRLLLGFETPASGQVCYDGTDLSTLDLSAVRRQCGVVLQQTSLLAGTVRENIGGPQHDLRDVQRAVELAGLADEVAGWPMGLETVVSAGTSTVSVGQAQRILLARALVHRPRLLLLDEATSALDNRTQQVVVRNLASLRVTRIVVAHRLSTVRDADRILVLDRGRIVQHGTPRQLSEDRSGLFHQLARRQLLTEPEPTDAVLD
jgi:ABC-type bacteriocin/lantibiotic exporter with double-glycine peptidase domain